MHEAPHDLTAKLALLGEHVVGTSVWIETRPGTAPSPAKGSYTLLSRSFQPSDSSSVKRQLPFVLGYMKAARGTARQSTRSEREAGVDPG